MSNRGRETNTYRVLKVTCGLQAAFVFLQGVSAGSFLSGVDHSVRLHEIGGWVTFLLAVAQAVIAGWSANGSPDWWFIISSAMVAIAEVLQLGTGYGHFLQVHIPLAILIVGMLIWQLVRIGVRRPATAREVTQP